MPRSLEVPRGHHPDGRAGPVHTVIHRVPLKHDGGRKAFGREGQMGDGRRLLHAGERLESRPDVVHGRDGEVGAGVLGCG